MKILALNGSYRVNGNTARMIQQVANRMGEIASQKGQVLEFEIVHLGHQNIGFCRGCRICFGKGENKCPVQDDLLAIYQKMQDADGLILASPVYVNDVSGIMKNWIDRMAFVCHRPAFAGKRALILTTVGLGPTRHAERTLSDALTTWGCSVVGRNGFKMGALMPKKRADSLFQDRVRKMVIKFYRALEKPVIPSFLSFMTFRIQQGYWWQQSDSDSIDYQYWQSQGWTQTGRDYYVNHQARVIKVTLARLVGAILAPFVT
jgi:multimeric flavodoxin WrbA